MKTDRQKAKCCWNCAFADFSECFDNTVIIECMLDDEPCEPGNICVHQKETTNVETMKGIRDEKNVG